MSTSAVTSKATQKITRHILQYMLYLLHVQQEQTQHLSVNVTVEKYHYIRNFNVGLTENARSGK